MDPGTLVTALAVLAIVAAVVGGVLAAVVVRRLGAQVRESRRELVALREQVRRSETAPLPDRHPESRPEPEFTITDLGVVAPTGAGATPSTDPAAPVTAREFAAVAAGESLVRVLSLGYGVARALQHESRHRIGYAVRTEIKRARRARRQELKLARRHLRAQAAAGPTDRVEGRASGGLGEDAA